MRLTGPAETDATASAVFLQTRTAEYIFFTKKYGMMNPQEEKICMKYKTRRRRWGINQI